MNSKAELWFTLLICEEEYPIISDLEFMGLITAMTNLNGKEIILKIKGILKRDPNFFKYILKIVPIDFVVKTEILLIKQIIEQHYKQFIEKNDSFRISLKRRKHESIERNSFIRLIAEKIDNEVDLENPDKIVRIEILGNNTGISFLKPDEILKIPNAYLRTTEL